MNESAIAGPGSIYREWQPPPQWRATVACLWEQRVVGGRYVQRLLPDSCADIIVAGDGRAVIAGPARRATLPLLEQGVLRGLRLRPEAIGPVLGPPAWELVDQTVPLEAVVSPRHARAAVHMLMTGHETAAWCTAAAANGAADAAANAAAWCTGADAEDDGAAAVDPRVRAACNLLEGAPAASVDLVADRVGLSGRQLRRLLLAATGQGPKLLQRVARLHRFLDLAEAGSAPWSLAALAATSGYADQAHLSREVLALSGTTPARLLRERELRVSASV